MRVLPNSSRLKLRVSFTRIHVLKTDYVCKWPQPWGQRDRRDFRSQPLMTCYSRSITGCRSNDRHDLLTSDPWPAVNKNSHNWTGEELFSKMEIYEQPMRRRQFYFKSFFIKIRIFFFFTDFSLGIELNQISSSLHFIYLFISIHLYLFGLCVMSRLHHQVKVLTGVCVTEFRSSSRSCFTVSHCFFEM